MEKRVYYFDNAKFLLILLVVFGHFLRPFIEEHPHVHVLYKFIYTFHMPAFILIAGFFAKGFQKKGYVKRITKKLILPYFIFQAIYSVYYFFLYGKDKIEFNPFNPQWSLWFLLSLFFWNIFLFLFTKLRASYGLTIAFLLGIFIGYIDQIDQYLSLSRTFVFFPFFLIGFYLEKEHFETLITKNKKIMGIVLLFIIYLLFYILPNFDFEWLFGSKSYHTLGTDVYGGLIRLGLYALTVISTFSFLTLVPKERYFFTKWGTRTLYVYLLHGFIIKYFRQSEWLDYIHNAEHFMMLMIISVILTFILSSKAIKTFTQPIIELKVTELKRMYKEIYRKTRENM
jgi:fucose 4-O-acetylase-like acetyltransferase